MKSLLQLVCVFLVFIVTSCSGPNMRALENDFKGDWGPFAVVGLPFALAFDAVSYKGMITYPSSTSSGASGGSSHTTHSNPVPSYAAGGNASNTVSNATTNWNTTCTGTWSAPKEVYFDEVTHQAREAITAILLLEPFKWSLGKAIPFLARRRSRCGPRQIRELTTLKLQLVARLCRMPGTAMGRNKKSD